MLAEHGQEQADGGLAVGLGVFVAQAQGDVAALADDLDALVEVAELPAGDAEVGEADAEQGEVLEAAGGGHRDLAEVPEVLEPSTRVEPEDDVPGEGDGVAVEAVAVGQGDGGEQAAVLAVEPLGGAFRIREGRQFAGEGGDAGGAALAAGEEELAGLLGGGQVVVEEAFDGLGVVAFGGGAALALGEVPYQIVESVEAHVRLLEEMDVQEALEYGLGAVRVHAEEGGRGMGVEVGSGVEAQHPEGGAVFLVHRLERQAQGGGDAAFADAEFLQAARLVVEAVDEVLDRPPGPVAEAGGDDAQGERELGRRVRPVRPSLSVRRRRGRCRASR